MKQQSNIELSFTKVLKGTEVRIEYISQYFKLAEKQNFDLDNVKATFNYEVLIETEPEGIDRIICTKGELKDFTFDLVLWEEPEDKVENITIDTSKFAVNLEYMDFKKGFTINEIEIDLVNKVITPTTN